MDQHDVIALQAMVKGLRDSTERLIAVLEDYEDVAVRQSAKQHRDKMIRELHYSINMAAED